MSDVAMTIGLAVEAGEAVAATCRNEFTRLAHACSGLTVTDAQTGQGQAQVSLASDRVHNGPGIHDAFAIDLKDGRLSIHANTDVALLIGVYRFFQEMGCRWTRPGRP